MEKTMKKTLLWVLAAGLSFVATPSLALDDQDIVTANLYAECSAIFSYLATEKQGKTPPDVIDSYYAASVAFYKAALAKGGDDMKAAYHTKMEELNSISTRDTVAVQKKKALEKQCRLAGYKDLNLRIKK